MARACDYCRAPWKRGQVNAGEVRALVKITLRARKREIAGIVRPAMLAGNDMFDVKKRDSKTPLTDSNTRDGFRRADGRTGLSPRPSGGFCMSEKSLRFSLEQAK